MPPVQLSHLQGFEVKENLKTVARIKGFEVQVK
jgi:hypothetical protein